MLRIRDAMTRDVLTVTSETTLREAAELFTSRHVSGAPVLDGQRVVGVVSATDVLEFVATSPPVPGSRTDEQELGEWAELPASEPGDAAAGAYFAEMWEDADAETTQRLKTAGVHRLLVIDEGKLVGIITSIDIARAVADHRLQERRLVFDRR
jgi:acetoin utilization protein AcuB